MFSILGMIVYVESVAALAAGAGWTIGESIGSEVGFGVGVGA